jgi:uncharacterized membrane-anchored protein
MTIYNIPAGLEPSYHMSYAEVLQSLGDGMSDKFFIIGIVAFICGAWHMSKYSRNNNVQTAFITGMIDMLAFGAGVAGIAFYAIYRGWIQL